LYGDIVENLCMAGAKAVENQTAKFFSARDANNPRRFWLWTRPSRVASLDLGAAANKIVAARNLLRTTLT
jgi:hypothetical protein